MIKSKPCTEYGCGQPRWAKGLCKRHQSLRTDGKAPKGIRKISEKGKVKKGLKKELFLNDAAFYLKIWESRPHVCYETGKQLGKMNLCMFHHVLPKQTYPQFRHCEFNIVLLSPEVHNQVEIDISKCPKVKELTEQLKEKYAVQHKRKSSSILEEEIPRSKKSGEAEELFSLEEI